VQSARERRKTKIRDHSERDATTTPIPWQMTRRKTAAETVNCRQSRRRSLDAGCRRYSVTGRDGNGRRTQQPTTSSADGESRPMHERTAVDASIDIGRSAAAGCPHCRGPGMRYRGRPVNKVLELSYVGTNERCQRNRRRRRLAVSTTNDVRTACLCYRRVIDVVLSTV